MSSIAIGKTSTRAHEAAAITSRDSVVRTVARSRPVTAAASGVDSPEVPARMARTLSRAPRRVQPLADAGAHEVADAGDGLLGFVEDRQEPVPDVDHLGPLLDLGVDTRGARSSAETDRVVEQHLFAAEDRKSTRLNSSHLVISY